MFPSPKVPMWKMYLCICNKVLWTWHSCTGNVVGLLHRYLCQFCNYRRMVLRAYNMLCTAIKALLKQPQWGSFSLATTKCITHCYLDRSAPGGLCSPRHANSCVCWGPALSGNAMLLMEENVIVEHNYNVSYSVITLTVFNIEHILKLNGMETPPKQNSQSC